MQLMANSAFTLFVTAFCYINLQICCPLFFLGFIRVQLR